MGKGGSKACGRSQVSMDAGMALAANSAVEYAPGFGPRQLAEFSAERRRWATGGCGALAQQIHQRTGWPLLGLYCEEERNGPYWEEFPVPDHVALLHPSGQLLDARGLVPCPPDAEPLSASHLEALFEADALPSPLYDEYQDAAEVAQQLLKEIGWQEPPRATNPQGLLNPQLLATVDSQREQIAQLAADYQPAADEWDIDHDWCGQTSEAVVEQLQARGVECELVEGTFSDGGPVAKLHRWVRLSEDGTILDATVAQFHRQGICPHGQLTEAYPGYEGLALVPSAHPFAARYRGDW